MVKLSGALILMVLTTAIIHSEIGQRVGQQHLDQETDGTLFDEVFPWPEIDLGAAPVTIAMRFRPSFSPESEIILRFNSESPATADEVKATKSISEFLSKERNLDGLDLPSILNSLGIERKKHQIDATLAKQWNDEFWNSLALSSTELKQRVGIVQLDGTRYELYLTSSVASWHLFVSDEEVDSHVSGGVPIVRWMNTVRLAVNKLQ